MKKIVMFTALCTAFLMFSGCGKNVYNVRLGDDIFETAITELPKSEQALVMAYMLRTAFTSSLGAVFNSDAPIIDIDTITIAQALAAQRNFTLKQQQATQERQRVEIITQKYRENLRSVYPFENIKLLYLERRVFDGVIVTGILTNRDSTTIGGLKFTLKFFDKFGDRLAECRLKFDVSIAPGAAVTLCDTLIMESLLTDRVKHRKEITIDYTIDTIVK